MIHQLHRPALDRLKRIKRIEPWYRNQFCVATKCGLSRWYHFPNARFRFWPLSVDTEESPESCWENEVGRWALCLAESPLKRTGHGIQQGTGSLHYWRWVCVVWAWQRLTCRMKQLPQLPRLTGEQEGTTRRHLATPKVWIHIVGVWSDHQWPQIQQLASLYSVKELHKSDLFTSYFKSSRKQALLDWNQ